VRYHCLIPLTAAAVNLLICALVARQGLRDPLRRAFAFGTLCVVGWNLDIFSLYYFTDAADAEWWSRIFRTGICFAPAATFHFGLALSESQHRNWRALKIGGYASGALLALANLQGHLVAGLTPHAWGWYPRPTRLFGVLAASLVLFLGLWAERVWHAFRHPRSSRQRVQAKFWLLGSLVQLPFVATNLLPIYGINVYPLGNVGNVLFVTIIAYAMVRHRLMDVDYIVRKGVSFGLAASVVLVPGGAGLSALCRAYAVDEPLAFVCSALALALVAIVLVPMLQEALETRVHRALFPNQHDARQRLRQLAADIVHVLDQGDLVERLGAGLVEILEVDGCEVFVRDEQTRRHVREWGAGDDAPLSDGVVAMVERLREPMPASELALDAPDAAPDLQRRGWEVVVPLRLHDRAIGLVALQHNRDFRLLSAEDLQRVGGVASAAAVALENARLSRQLRRSELVLERANRLSSIGTLAGGIAHEIRNPLVAVKTFLDLLPERLDDHEFLTSFRNLSLSELRRVTNLINDLLSLGKTTTAGRRTVALAEALEPVLRLMESTAHKRDVRLVEETEAGLPPVFADPDQLKQIGLNLILNAIEVSPPHADVRLVLRRGTAADESPAVILEVHDHGPGIPRDHVDDIFLPFFTTKDGGTGLGLAMVHQMVVEHGGDITVDTAPGRGTTFRVVLPVARAELATGT
jgi:signal transduction histidine kinase